MFRSVYCILKRVLIRLFPTPRTQETRVQLKAGEKSLRHHLGSGQWAEDASALGFNSHGGTGCISVIANVAPRLSADFQNAMSKGDYKKALMLQDKLLPLHRATFLEPSPCPIKYALSKLGKCQNEVRSPLVRISKETQNVMDQALENANIIS